MILNNIYRCRNCKIHLIAEEKNNHMCRKAKKFHIVGDILWLYDIDKGQEIKYPLKLGKIGKWVKYKNDQPTGHPTTQKKTGHLDYTEPLIS